MKKLLSGFTLLELIIAIAISALVAVGVFSMFSSIANIRDHSVEASQDIILIETLTRLINRDARMMLYNTLSVDENSQYKKLKFSTQNSLRFNKAIPVTVYYYVDDNNWLIRQEENTEMIFSMEMRILPNVSNLDFSFYDGSNYTESIKPNAKMMNLTLDINNRQVTIPIARTMDNIQ